MNAKPFAIERFSTPTGGMLLVTDADERLRALDWSEERLHRLFGRQRPGVPGPFRFVERAEPSAARRAVEAYFDGNLRALESASTAATGTPFQELVWAALRRIPAGETRSYGELALSVGRPSASRAVGLANGANPINLVVPCHRVIGADASLTGYGGGLDRKRWLLAHEGARFRRAGDDAPQLALVQ